MMLMMVLLMLFVPVGGEGVLSGGSAQVMKKRVISYMPTIGLRPR